MKDFKWPPAVAVSGTNGFEGTAGFAPTIEEKHDAPHFIEWTEGQHRRGFEVAQVLTNEPDTFEFVDTMGRTITLETLTLEKWNEEIAVTENTPKFETMEDLLAAMEVSW